MSRVVSGQVHWRDYFKDRVKFFPNPGQNWWSAFGCDVFIWDGKSVGRVILVVIPPVVAFVREWWVQGRIEFEPARVHALAYRLSRQLGPPVMISNKVEGVY